jgi:hypothetical protein
VIFHVSEGDSSARAIAASDECQARASMIPGFGVVQVAHGRGYEPRRDGGIAVVQVQVAHSRGCEHRRRSSAGGWRTAGGYERLDGGIVVQVQVAHGRKCEHRRLVVGRGEAGEAGARKIERKKPEAVASGFRFHRMSLAYSSS